MKILHVYSAVRLFWFYLPCAQVWDIRTKAHVSALTGHDNTVCSVFARPTVRKPFDLLQAITILSSSEQLFSDVLVFIVYPLLGIVLRWLWGKYWTNIKVALTSWASFCGDCRIWCGLSSPVLDMFE
jgi:hypothetical protein